jgi:hypothetical protein
MSATLLDRLPMIRAALRQARIRNGLKDAEALSYNHFYFLSFALSG